MNMDMNRLHHDMPWLSLRLAKRYPDQSAQSIKSYLATIMATNDHFFIRSADAIALARLVKMWGEPARVEEVFVLSVDGDDQHSAADMYPHIYRWAQSLGAAKMEIERFSDASRVTFAEVMHRPHREERWVVNVKPVRG